MNVIRLILFIACYIVYLQASAQPGKNGAVTISSPTVIVNQYSPLSSPISIGNNTLSVASTPVISLCEGDLIMVYQAQGASINTTNSSAYGNITNYNSAGFYEFKYVQSVLGNIITTQTSFTNSYALSGRPQVIKVPQYTTLTINSGSSIVPKPWKDTTIAATPYRFGGLVVIHATQIVNNGTITATGQGFRGGQMVANIAFQYAVTDYVSSLATRGAEKGEGIFGYKGDYDINNGRYCRGAAANGGGGGNSVNSSGGGGANGYNGNPQTGQGVMVTSPINPLTAWALDPGYISNGNALTNASGGGRGGYSWSNANGNAVINAPGNAIWQGDFRREIGGLGGYPLTNINSETRIYFGGGGGAGHANDNGGTSGANGGGIVYLISTFGIFGSGNISSNGNNVPMSPGCSCDGLGGGGGGGSIVIKTSAISVLHTMQADGGNGGSQPQPNSGNPFEAEGGGGGGGGGLTALWWTIVPVPSQNGGQNGISLSVALTEMTSNGGTKGAAGQTNTVSLSFITYTTTPPTLLATSNSPVCEGATLNFAGLSAATYTWLGPNNFLSFQQNPSIVNTTPAHSGNYFVQVLFQGACSSTTLNLPVVINPVPTISTISSTICAGSVATLSALGVTSPTWNPGGNTTANLLVNPLVTTVYTVTGAPVSGCSPVGTATAFVLPSMTLNITASSPSACVGNSVTLNSNISGGSPGYNYTWTAGPTSPSYITSQLPGIHGYTLTASDANNCKTVKTHTLLFTALPAISVTNVSICPSSAATLTATGATSYSWSQPAFTGNPLTVSPSATTVYSVTGSANGCTATASVSVVVKNAPVISVVSAGINCASLGSATVNTLGGGPYSYSWTPSAQTTSIASGLYPATYTVSVFDITSGCTSSLATLFVSPTAFTGTVSATSSLACNGVYTGTASIAVSGGSGSQSFLWSHLSGPQSMSLVANLGAGMYTVTANDALTFCSVTQTFLIAEPLPLSPNIIASSPIACVGNSVNMNSGASGGTPPYSFSWINGPNNATYMAMQNNPGNHSYTINVADANNCIASAIITLTFVAYPILTVTNATICEGNATTLLVSGADAYSWSHGGPTTNTFLISPISTTNYSVTGTSSMCATVKVVTVIVNQLPVPGITGNTSVCSGLPVNLTATGSGSYQWYGPAGFTQSGSTLIIPALLPAYAGTYTLAVTNNNNCTAITSTTVSALALPVPSASGMSVCAGQNASLYGSGGTTYTWTGPGNYTSYTSIAVLNQAISSGNYTLSVTNNSACTASTTVQLLVYNYTLPVPIINTNPKVCLNSKINLAGYGGGTYIWEGPDGFKSTYQNPQLIANSLNMSGIYTLTVKNQSNCVASTTVEIKVNALPTATLLSSNDKSCIPLCSHFSLKTNTNGTPLTATSYMIDGSYASETSFNYCITRSGNRQVNVTFTDSNGCANSSSLSLTVYPIPIADFKFSPEKPIESEDHVHFINHTSGLNIDKWAWFFTDNNGGFSQLKDPIFFYEKAGNYAVAMIATNTWGVQRHGD